MNGLEQAGSAMPGEQVASAGRWVAANVRWLRPVVGILGVVILLWGNDVSVSRWWWCVFGVVFVLALLQVLVGAGRRPMAAAPPPATTPAPGVSA